MAYNSEDIKSYTALQHMRRKSEMWGFRVGSLEGNLIQIKELVDNSIDEAQDPSRIYPIKITFFVSKDKSTYQCLIQDNGRGIPPDKIVDVFTKAFTSGKYEEVSGYGSSIGTNGVGSKVVSALSSMFRAFTCRKDGFGYVHVRKGEVKDHLIVGKTKSPWKKDSDTGTVVIFQPDAELLTTTNTFFGKNAEGVVGSGFQTHLDRMEFYTLFKHNIKLVIRVVDGLLREGSYGDTPQEMWKYLSDVNNFGGKVEFESDLDITPRKYVIKKYGLKEPIWDLGGTLSKAYIQGSDDRLGFDVDVFLDDKSLKGENGIIGAVNATPIFDQESVHFTMLQNVIKTYLIDYILDKAKKDYFELRYKIPFSGCVSVIWKGAGFDGQDKSKFTDNVFGDYYRSHLRRQLNKLPESVWERLYELITEHFEQAFARYAKTQYKMNKNLVGIGYILKRTGSYIPCESTDPDEIELYIVEGDSAAGPILAVRDERTQAVFKMSGKPLNAIRANSKQLVANEVYQDLMEILGVRPTDPDTSNMRFKKGVYIATDADPDGYHINVLLIGIFKRIHDNLLEDGYFHLTNPPLYSFRIQGHKRPLYLRDRTALMDMKTEIYRCLLDLYFQENGKKEIKLTEKAYGGLCAIVEVVGDRVDFISNQLNIDPFVLEQLIYCVDYLDERHPDTKMIEKTLKDAGVQRAIWDKDSNSIILVIQGLEYLVPLSHLKQLIEGQILPIYEKYHWKEFMLFVTTRHTDRFLHTPASFMMLYSIFKSITGDENKKNFSITRFKGLGEMSQEDILGTCVDPHTRCTFRITSMGDVNNIYSMLGADSEARKQLSDNSLHGRLVDQGFLED